MVLRILGCSIGGRNGPSKVCFKIEIPLPEHLLDSGGWRRKRKRKFDLKEEILSSSFLNAKLGLETFVSSWFGGEEKECFDFLNEWKKKIGTRLSSRFGPFRIEELKEKKNMGEENWGKRNGNRERGEFGIEVDGMWGQFRKGLFLRFDDLTVLVCDSESRSGMTQQDEKTWKKYLGREEKKEKSGGFCFERESSVSLRMKMVWTNGYAKEKIFWFCQMNWKVISLRAEVGRTFPLKKRKKNSFALENSPTYDFRWASLLGRQICETVTQVSKARLGEDRNLAWTARRKAGLTKLFSKEIRLETRA